MQSATNGLHEVRDGAQSLPATLQLLRAGCATPGPPPRWWRVGPTGRTPSSTRTASARKQRSTALTGGPCARVRQVYAEPTVLLARRVTGEEEVPAGCVAVLTPDAPDVLSHVSVRARNMRVLFATCHERGPLQEIEAAAGKARGCAPAPPRGPAGAPPPPPPGSKAAAGCHAGAAQRHARQRAARACLPAVPRRGGDMQWPS